MMKICYQDIFLVSLKISFSSILLIKSTNYQIEFKLNFLSQEDPYPAV